MTESTNTQETDNSGTVLLLLKARRGGPVSKHGHVGLWCEKVGNIVYKCGNAVWKGGDGVNVGMACGSCCGNVVWVCGNAVEQCGKAV